MKVAPEFPLYHVGYDGTVKNRKTKKELKPSLRKNGRKSILLVDRNGKRKKISLMRLIGLAHVPRPEDFDTTEYHAGHKDNDHTNDHVDNFIWQTPQQNILQSHLNSKSQRYGANKKAVRITDSDGNSRIVHGYTEAARQLGVCLAAVQKCIREQRKLKREFLIEPLTNEIEGEEWKPIPTKPGFTLDDSYQVSNLGRVRSKHTNPYYGWMSEEGYMTTYIGGRAKLSNLIHVLVCEAFNGGYRRDLQCCHYPDPDTTNNRAENLIFATSGENCSHKSPESRGCIPVKAISVHSGEEMVFESRCEAARVLQLNQRKISSVINGSRSKEGGHLFMNVTN